MNFVLYMPVLANAPGKGFDGFFQRADVIASGRLLDQDMFAFENMPIARNFENRLQPRPLMSIR